MSDAEKYDYEGYVTRNGIKRSDGLIFSKKTFARCDGMKVPLIDNGSVYNPEVCLGHALLENREDGVYAKCVFDANTDLAKETKKLLIETDKVGLSFSAIDIKRSKKDSSIIESGRIIAIHVTPKYLLFTYPKRGKRRKIPGIID